MKRVLKPKTHNAESAINQARALYYDFFAGFFLYELLDSRFGLFVRQIDFLSASPLNTQDLSHFRALKDSISNATINDLKREYSQIFNIPFASKTSDSALHCGDSKTIKDSQITKDSSVKDSSSNMQDSTKSVHIFLYLSHYIDGCINGKSLLDAKEFVKNSKFRLNKENFKESEEHFGFLLLFMRHLLQDSTKNSSDIFNALLAPMASYIAESLTKCKHLHYYHLVGALLKSFIDIEEQICRR